MLSFPSAAHTELFTCSSVILSTVSTEMNTVENQSAAWLITVNMRAGYWRLLACTVWYECIYLGRWKSFFIPTEATLLLPTAAEIRHVSLLLIQHRKLLSFCWGDGHMSFLLVWILKSNYTWRPLCFQLVKISLGKWVGPGQSSVLFFSPCKWGRRYPN